MLYCLVSAKMIMIDELGGGWLGGNDVSEDEGENEADDDGEEEKSMTKKGRGKWLRELAES